MAAYHRDDADSRARQSVRDVKSVQEDDSAGQSVARCEAAGMSKG